MIQCGLSWTFFCLEIELLNVILVVPKRQNVKLDTVLDSRQIPLCCVLQHHSVWIWSASSLCCVFQFFRQLFRKSGSRLHPLERICPFTVHCLCLSLLHPCFHRAVIILKSWWGQTTGLHMSDAHGLRPKTNKPLFYLAWLSEVDAQLRAESRTHCVCASVSMSQRSP